MNNLKYFMYLRKSTDRDDMQTLSIDGQRMACEAYATANQLVIVDTIVEHQSAKAPGRPVFASMLERIEKGEADAILSYHPNRLARNSKDGGELIYWLDIGILKDLRFPTFRFGNDPQGKSMLGIEFAQSKRYSDDLAVVTKRGLDQKCLRGEYPGPAPRGYLNDHRTKTIRLDRSLAPVIVEAFERFATGAETIESLRIFLASKGVISRGRKGFRGGRPIDKETVHNMLVNPIYYGAFRYAGVLYDGKHEPILSKKLFDRVQKVMNMRAPTVKQWGNPKPFTKLIRCAQCGMAITAETQKGITYYRCSKRSRFVLCSSPYVRSDDLERMLFEALVQFSLSTPLAKELSDRVEARYTKALAEIAATRESLRERQQSVSRKLDILTETYLDGNLDRPTFVKKQNELQSEKTSLKAEMAEIERGHFGWLEPARKWIKTAQLVHKLVPSSPPLEKRLLAVEIFGSNLTLDGKRLAGRATKPWDALLNFNSSVVNVPVYDAVRSAFGIPE